uniref:Tripartite motif-containing protein 2 n=1 Tax=Magallana gigas TaxID=29159 RepID=K1PVE4_MAGGI|eukprot:XP_011414342.1 PREDICTED: uncharacterized protein LOC105318747 [Crassostrea gigas]
MALSKSQMPDTAQHYLVCGTEDCEKNCQFYCNPCHLHLCEQCRDEHQKSSETKNHEVVSYRQRQHQLPVEKCKDHPTKDIDMLCEDCQIPVCSKCVIQDHQKHTLNDLETIYSKGFTLCLDEIYKIHQYFIPTSQDMQKVIMKDTKQIKATMDKIRTSMMAEAESLKCLVDTVLSDKIEQVNKMEVSLIEELQSQEKTYQDYISSLNDLVKEFQGYLSSTKLQNNALIFALSDRLKIQPIPKTTKPVPPVFTAGQYSKEDVTKLLGRVTVPDTKPENRKIKPMETSTTQLSLSSTVIKFREYTVPGVDRVLHISLDKSGTVWGSDNNGNLVQTDLQGNQLQKIQTSGGFGYHTVTQGRDLMNADIKNKVINRIKQDNTINEFIKTGDWKPLSIYSSRINGNILVGKIEDEEAKVTRYNRTGEEIQNIQRNNKGQGLYKYPHYITENINGDVCTSDLYKQAVVVVNKSGQHRFSYRGQRLGFSPCGICSDLLGHIIVSNCQFLSESIHLLDQDGQFLSLLLTSQQGVNCPRGMCVDDKNNLHVGQMFTNTVTVYKYLQ